MKFSSNGIPILTLSEKLAALTVCIDNEECEDAAGHLCDLLEWCRKRIIPSSVAPFASVREMAEYYGDDPTPIEEGAT